MLTALDDFGTKVEATRHLPTGEYRCPLCERLLIVKRGRVKTPHFAHRPPIDCALAFETREHLAAKALLAHRFREFGFECDLEVPLRTPERRVDVAVTLAGTGVVAVEVQATAISVDEIKARMSDHRRNGYVTTGWVFTSTRCPKLLTADEDEVRVPGEIAYLHHRCHQALNVLHVATGQMCSITLGRVTRVGEDYYVEGGGGEMEAGSTRTLKRTFTVAREIVGFIPTLVRGRYSQPGSPDWTLTFS